MTPVRRGGPVVLWTPEDVNLGNFLYHWLHAHAEQSAGRRVHALGRPRWSHGWRRSPNAARLVTSRRDVPLRAQHVPGYWQRWGEAFTRQDLVRFVTDVLLDSPLRDEIAGVSRRRQRRRQRQRGDYYSVPRFRERYAFDVLDYVERAMALSAARAPVGEVHVVSDDNPLVPSAPGSSAPPVRRRGHLRRGREPSAREPRDACRIAQADSGELDVQLLGRVRQRRTAPGPTCRRRGSVVPRSLRRPPRRRAARPELDDSRESTNEWGLSDG